MEKNCSPLRQTNKPTIISNLINLIGNICPEIAHLWSLQHITGANVLKEVSCSGTWMCNQHNPHSLDIVAAWCVDVSCTPLWSSSYLISGLQPDMVSLFLTLSCRIYIEQQK